MQKLMIKNKGFTLIELLVTILIVSILATYSILAYRNSIFESENKYAKAKLEVINAGIERMEAEYPGAFAAFISQGDNKFKSESKSCRFTEDGANKGKFYPHPNALISCGFVPQIEFDADSLKYNFFLNKEGDECAIAAEGGATTNCNKKVFMRPKPEAKTGRDTDYCACIDRRGRAYDGS